MTNYNKFGIKMNKTIFKSQLLEDGHLFCPKKYAIPNAHYEVIVYIPDYEATDAVLEVASVVDLAEDILTEEEIDYYLQLKES